MHRTLVFLATALLSFLLHSTLPGQQWTRFHGSNGQGVAALESFPATWTDDDLVFKISLPGIGHSSPVIWGEKVFLLSANPKTAERHLLCIDAASGETLWQQDFPSTTHQLHLRSSYASSTPAVDKDMVYFAWSDPQHTYVKAFSHAGKLQWSVDLGTWSSQHGFGTSPVIYQDLIFLNASQASIKLPAGIEPGESFVYALDKTSGVQRWKVPRGSASASYSVPAIYAGENGDELICANTTEGLYSLDPITGRENWAIQVFNMRTVSSPIFYKELILGSTGSGGGGNSIVAVQPGKQPQIRFKIDRSAPYVPTSVIRDDLLFCFYDKGILTCIEMPSGQTVYQQRLDCAFSGSPIRIGNKLYCIDEEGIVHVVAASREFKLLGKNPLGEPSRSTPAVSGGRMYLRTYSHLICVGAKKS